MAYNVKLNQLRAYQAIMLTGSVTAAAERLHATQPAISRQLASLEDATQLRLFDRRSGGRMIPTALGLQFFRHIEGTLSGIEDIPDIAKQLVQSAQTRLRVGATPPLLNSAFVSSALQSFLRKYPATRLTLESRARHDIEEWVANGQTDVGFALLPADNPWSARSRWYRLPPLQSFSRNTPWLEKPSSIPGRSAVSASSFQVGSCCAR